MNLRILSARSWREVNSPRRSMRRVRIEKKISINRYDVEPAGVFGRVGHGEARVIRQPCPRGCGRVRGPVVQDQVDLLGGVQRLVELSEELDESVGVVANDDLRVDGAGGDVHRGQQRHGAVPDVLELPALGAAGPDWPARSNHSGPGRCEAGDGRTIAAGPVSSWAGEPVPGFSGLVGQRRYGLDAAAGSQGRPANRARSTGRACWPFLRAVDREERAARNARAPDSDRQPPEIFCCSFTIRTSRSAWLLSKGTRKSLAKRSTSSRCRSSRDSSAAAGPSLGRPRLPVRGGGGLSRWPSTTNAS